MPRSGPLREGSQGRLAARGTLVSMPPEPKTCQSCGRTVEDVDHRLEETILDLLAQRARTSTICPSDAARAVGDEDSWRDLMEPARRAARRLVDRGEVDITQGGHVVDPSTATGPIRIRRR
jgi:Protein of unknown function (DUF3253)